MVANRGEIAFRIMKTVKKLNIESVDLYSKFNKYSEHAKMLIINMRWKVLQQPKLTLILINYCCY